MTQLLKANATRPISRLMPVDVEVRGTPRDSHDAVRRSYGPPRSTRTRGGACEALQQPWASAAEPACFRRMFPPRFEK